MDRELFDFAAVRAAGTPQADGDKAFDPEDDFPDSAAKVFSLKPM
jgi:hypothetical protein